MLFGSQMGHWYMVKCFQIFVWVFIAVGGKKMSLIKNCHNQAGIPVQIRPENGKLCATPTHQNFWSFYAFSSLTRENQWENQEYK